MPSSRSTPHLLAAWLLVTAGIVAGCHQLFPEFEVALDTEEALTLCEAGSYRCVGPWLTSCSDTEEAWQQVEVCSSEAHCDSRSGQCRACVPESHRCNGSVLEACDGGGSWAPVEQCQSEDACNLNSDSCRPCVAGEFQCNQRSLLQCTQNQQWQEVRSCSESEACVVGEDRMTGDCRPPACDTPGQYQCDGVRLQRCSSTRDRLVQVDICQSPELCDAAAANEQARLGLLGTCRARCEPGALRCRAENLETCNAQGNGWQLTQTCASAAECSASVGGCQACIPDSVECNDGELRRCVPSGWETLRDCGRADLCDAAGARCGEPGCPVANQAACLPDGLHRCLPDQSGWDLLTVCEGELCNASDQRCDTAACDRGQVRCHGASLQRCSDSLRHWDLVAECGESEVCELDGCRATACEVGAFRCNDLYLEQCDADGWHRVDRCATRELCNDGAGNCRAPVCGLGEFRCVGTGLQRCEEDRTGWADLGDCADEGLECDSASGRCRPPS